MSRRPIPVVLPDLPERAPNETPPAVRARIGIPTQTMVLGRNDGDVTGIVEDCTALQDAGWLESFLVVARPDGAGHFVMALARQEQAAGLLQANAWYRLAERVQARAFVKRDFPAWARAGALPDGEPTHVFWGVAIPDDVEPESER